MTEQTPSIRNRKWTTRRLVKTSVVLAVLLVSMLSLTAWEGGMKKHGGWSWTWPPGGSTPYVEILEVERNETVTVEAHRFPEGTELTVTMGYMWTRGVNGFEVATITVGPDSYVGTFDIPDELADQYRISIRLQSGDKFPYYAFNWFYNNSTN